MVERILKFLKLYTHLLVQNHDHKCRPIYHNVDRKASTQEYNIIDTTVEKTMK